MTDELSRRLSTATVRARELVGVGADAGAAGLRADARAAGVRADAGAAGPRAEAGPPDLAELRRLIAALRGMLTPGELEAAAVAEQEAALDRLRRRFETRFEALARIQTAIGELREVTSPREMLSRAPAALCSGSAFQRAIVSLVKGGRMVAEAVHFTGQSRLAAGALERLQANPLRLEHTLIETELLRRRRATIVVDAEVHPRVDRATAELMGWRSYAAAPLVVGAQVLGVIHADRGAAQPLDVLDRDVLWEFATGLAQAYESTALRRTLRDERDQTRELLQWLRIRSSELTDARVTLSSGAAAPPPDQPPEPAPAGGAGPSGRDDRVVFEGLLTRRELDVLRLMSDGATNQQIADALVISSGTVKFHVGSILRKLRAANRAEAVTRYLRLMGMRVP